MMGEEHILNQMSHKLRSEQSHQLENMLISCRFNNQPCDKSNFTKFYDNDLGNCYTFKAENNGMITTTGPKHGLRLELYVELNEYIGKFSETSGFKVLVHDKNEIPVPGGEGLVVSPGAHTQIAFKKSVIKQASTPYGSCRKSSPYSQKICLKSCVQNHLISSCQCFNKRLYNGSISNILQLKPCNMERSDCVRNITIQYENNGLCIEDCPLPCLETKYESQLSFGMWPVEERIASTMNRFQDVLRNVDVFIPTDVYKGDNSMKKEYIRANFVKLDVFYNQLSYIYIENTRFYPWSSFLADIGGLASLWIGFSLLSIFEIIEFIMTLVEYKPEVNTENMQSSCKSDNTNEFLV